MQTHKFKTDINCVGCVKMVSRVLDALPQTEWQVDIHDPDRILMVRSVLRYEKVQAILVMAGFQATAG